MIYIFSQSSYHVRHAPALTHHYICACAWASPLARPFRCQPLSCRTARTSCAPNTGSVCPRIGGFWGEILKEENGFHGTNNLLHYSVDELYRFINTWVKHLYGELDEEQIKSRGFELIQEDTEWTKSGTTKAILGGGSQDGEEISDLTRESWEVSAQQTICGRTRSCLGATVSLSAFPYRLTLCSEFSPQIVSNFSTNLSRALFSTTFSSFEIKIKTEILHLLFRLCLRYKFN